MKKSLFLVSVPILMICSTLVEIVANPAMPSVGDVEMKISQESIELAMSELPEIGNQLKVNEMSSSNVEDVVIDLWHSATSISLINDATYDATLNQLIFPGSISQSQQLMIGVNESGNYAWHSIEGATYNFSGKLSSNGFAEVIPCIVYQDNETSSLYIMRSAEIVLDENNGYTSDFNVSVVNKISNEELLLVAFLIKNSSEETTIISTENEFSCSYKASVAQKWSKENDLPGLGLNTLDSERAYTVLCEDGITTLGLYYENEQLYVTGINTSASEVAFPEHIMIDNSTKNIDYFGKTDMVLELTSAPNLTKLYIEKVRYVYNLDFSKTMISDLYVGASCYLENIYDSSSIYLHVPYGCNRESYYGFKRVLVGEEQSYYPEPTYSDWVIAGENEGDYFGISYLDGMFCISEIFTESDSIVLPIGTPAAGGMYYIRALGVDSYYWSDALLLCGNASKLKTITVPDSYTFVNVSWSNNPIINLHMQGNVPTTEWILPANMNVYTAQSYYFNYKNDQNWNRASILPDGWDFEWMTVNVERKGMFAQTYIEMTNADWGLGMYVKVTGALNDGDLINIKNLTNLIKLDLSEAEFTELPSSFLSDKNSLVEVILPNSLTYISDRAFQNCYSLQTVTAANINSVGESAFDSCIKLTNFDISKVDSIDSDAFYNCGVFNPQSLSSSLNFLGSYAFAYSGITEVSIPESIITLNSNVFQKCNQLEKATLPNTMVSLGSQAFADCVNLAEINLPEGITEIGYSAFKNCSRLTEIILPSTLQSIGQGAFNGCSSLLTVKCKAIVPPTTNGEFTYGIDFNHCVLYIAPFTIDAYRDASDWNRFYIMKPLNEPVKNIYINRPMSFDLMTQDNAVLQENPNITLYYSSTNSYNNSVGQLSASGDGTLSAGVFSIYHYFKNRADNTYYDYDIRTTLINNAENMRADNVMCSIEFERNRWHFISFQYDVKMEDITGVYNTDFVIRRYNSANRASGDGLTSNWEQLSTDDVLEAGKGYIIQVANNAYDENGYSYPAVVMFPSRNTVSKNRLFTSNNIIVPLEEYPAEFAHNRSWNLVGNPYPCYYDMHYLMDDFATPIVLWRGKSYQAYSPIDDDIILRPNEAFFVQRPLDTEEMVFAAEGRMHFNEAYNSSVTPGSNVVAKHAKTINTNRSVFNFNIEGCGSDDRTRIVINEDAAMEYEINCDASKFFAEVSEGAEIYVDGTIKYDICERPFADGSAVIGTRIAKDGVYTISLTGRSIDGWNVILEDIETGAVVNLTESSYQFEAKAGTTQSRFVITFKAPATNSIDNIISSENNSIVRVVDTTGVTVFEGNINDFKANANAGVYIVIDSDKAYKIVVK